MTQETWETGPRLRRRIAIPHLSGGAEVTFFSPRGGSRFTQDDSRGPDNFDWHVCGARRRPARLSGFEPDGCLGGPPRARAGFWRATCCTSYVLCLYRLLHFGRARCILHTVPGVGVGAAWVRVRACAFACVRANLTAIDDFRGSAGRLYRRYLDIWLRMCPDMCIDVRMEICTEMGMDMCVEPCIDMCTGS